MNKISSLQRKRDEQNLDSYPFHMVMPVCGERVEIQGRYVTFYGRINSYHVELLAYATSDHRKINDIHDRVNEYLDQWIGNEIGEEYG